MPSGVNFDKTLNFQPGNMILIVGVNNTLQWTNKDTADHSVTFIVVPSGVTASALTNTDVAPGEVFGPITLSTPGTYQYHCTFHPFWMRATIIVKAGK
jgi:plastocyanin